MSLSTGSKLGPYEIQAPIGAGGMGEVFRAVDTRLHRTVAIKILPHDKVADPERRRRFLQEARAASALSHPHIVTVHDLACDNGVDYLVMEYVPGKPLDTLITAKGLPLKQAVDYTMQIAGALAAAHAAGIVHRDVKPGNVIVDPEGQVRVLDFGLAKLEERAPDAGDQTRTIEPAMTAPGFAVGTVAYMSPEQAAAGTVDYRTDIFSLGVMLYEMVAGRRPFGGKSNVDTMHAIINDPAPPLGAGPPELQDVLDRALAKDRKARYQHAGDLALDLGRLLTRPAGAGVASSGGRRVARSRWPLAVACGVAILTVTGFWRLATEPQQPDMSRYRLKSFAAEEEAERFPSWSPDGKSIAYAVQRKARFELTVKSLDGSPPVVLTTTTHDFDGATGLMSITWAPDGSRLYYIESEGTTFGRVLSIARAGGEPQQLLDGLADAAALSPDGATLAALMREETNGQKQRVLTLFSSSGTTGFGSAGKRLRTFPGVKHQSRIAWSPDGARLALWSQDPQIWLIDARSGEVKGFPSPASASIIFNLTWLDNRQLVLSWPREEDAIEARTDLRLLDTATGQMRLLFSGTEPLSDPAVSPDGRSLAFTSGSANFDVVELPLDGGQARPLVATGHWEEAGDWSPVAPEFIYVTVDGIRLRSKDGSRDSLVVTPANFRDKVIEFVSPSFSPDGKQIVYTTDFGAGRTRTWISRLAGGAPAPLGNWNGIYSAAWSPDKQWLVFNLAENKWPPNRMAKIRIAGGAPVVLADRPCDFAPSWSPDGRRILCSRENRLYTIPAEGGSPEFLGAEYEPLASWSRELRFIFAIRRAAGKRELGRLDWQHGSFQPILDVPKGWFLNTDDFGQVRLSLSPDGKALATTALRGAGDIWILEGFQPPPNLWQRLWRR